MSKRLIRASALALAAVSGVGAARQMLTLQVTGRAELPHS